MAKIICYITIFHLTSLMSSHYIVKHKSTKFLQNVYIISCTEFHCIETGAKVNGAYYRDNLLAKELLSDIFRISQGGVLSFNRTAQWRIEHDHRCLPGAKGARPTSFIQHWPPNSMDLNPVDY